MTFFCHPCQGSNPTRYPSRLTPLHHRYSTSLYHCHQQSGYYPHPITPSFHDTTAPILYQRCRQAAVPSPAQQSAATSPTPQATNLPIEPYLDPLDPLPSPDSSTPTPLNPAPPIHIALAKGVKGPEKQIDENDAGDDQQGYMLSYARDDEEIAILSKDPNMPKRPVTMFFLFMEDFRKTYKEEQPEKKGGAVEGGEKWKSMTEEEKQTYIDRAAELKAEYEKAMETCQADDGDEAGDDQPEELCDEDA
ncbi:hypothetical protein Droror1_Dr00019491 [Drosera rotundifolia]